VIGFRDIVICMAVCDASVRECTVKTRESIVSLTCCCDVRSKILTTI
jgi:hypothetical protein